MILYKNGGLGILLSHLEGGRGVLDQYACVPLIGSIFSHLLRHRGALFEGRAYRRSHQIQGHLLSRHLCRHTLRARIIINGKVSVSVIILLRGIALVGV